jgi:hypothetical protein
MKYLFLGLLSSNLHLFNSNTSFTAFPFCRTNERADFLKSRLLNPGEHTMMIKTSSVLKFLNKKSPTLRHVYI